MQKSRRTIRVAHCDTIIIELFESQLGSSIAPPEPWFRISVKASISERVRMQSGVVSSHIEVEIHHVTIEHPRGLYGSEMAKLSRLLCASTVGMSPVESAKELVLCAGNTVEAPC